MTKIYQTSILSYKFLNQSLSQYHFTVSYEFSLFYLLLINASCYFFLQSTYLYSSINIDLLDVYGFFSFKNIIDPCFNFSIPQFSFKNIIDPCFKFSIPQYTLSLVDLGGLILLIMLYFLYEIFLIFYYIFIFFISFI